MILAPKLKNEIKRLKALKEFNILDTLTEEDYDNLAKIAGQICDVPVSMITFIGEDTQFIKSAIGLDMTHAPRDISFCGHTLLNPNEPLIVSNTLEDERFADNPYVAGEFSVRFYAGVPILSPEGFPIGTFCLYDMQAKELTEYQIDALRSLTRQVEKLLELKYTVEKLNNSKELLESQNKSLTEFTYMISHDVKAPIRNMKQFADIILEDYSNYLPEEGREILTMLGNCAEDATNLINGVVNYTKSTFLQSDNLQEVRFEAFVKKILADINPSQKYSLTFNVEEKLLKINYFPLYQIFNNLISNAFKYNDKAIVDLDFKVVESMDSYSFEIKDNGIGIPQQKLANIFNLFYMVEPEKSKSNNSTGVGLSIVKSLIEQLGGGIHVESHLGVGTIFSFHIKKID